MYRQIEYKKMSMNVKDLDNYSIIQLLHNQLNMIIDEYAIDTNKFSPLNDAIEEIKERIVKLESQANPLSTELYYKFLLDNQGEGLGIVDLEENFIFTNPVADELFGLKKGELIHRNLREFVSDEYFDKIKKETLKRLNNEKSVYELEIITANGCIRNIMLTSTVYYEGGEIKGTIGVFRDITEKKQIEKKLIESELSYTNLFNTLSETIYILNNNGVFLKVNKAAELMYGYDSEEIIGKTPEFLSAEGLNDINEVQKILLNVYNTGISQTFDFWGKRKDGCIFPKEVIASKGVYYGQNVIITTARDITERKLNEARLVNSEKKYKNLFENNPMPMWIYCIDSLRFLEVNNAAIAHYGYSKEEFLSLSLYDIRPEYEYINLQQKLAEINQNYTYTGIMTHKKKDNKLFDVEIISHSIDIEGKKARLVMANDITEKRRIETLITNERILLRTLIDNIPDAVYVKDAETRKLIANKADLDNINAQNEADIIGKNDFDLFPYEIAQKFYQDDIEVMQQAKPVINHIEFLRSHNGSEKWLSTSKFPLFNDKGQVIGLVGIGRDITSQKNAEKKIIQLSKGIEQNPAAIVITNINGNIEYVNERFSDISGYTVDELLGQNPRILKSGFTPEIEYKKLWKTITAGNEWRGDFLNKKKNGDLFWESALISPIRDDMGEIINFIGIKEDITHRKQMENDLITAKEKAEESDRLKTAFLNNMSHEIRTPLNAIVGFTTLLSSDGLPSAKQKTFIDIIQRSSDQLLSIITDIINISTIEAGQLRINAKQINLNQLLDDLYDQFSIKADENVSIQLFKSLNDDNAIFTTDETKLTQIISNLLVNALKFTNKGFIQFGYKIHNNQLLFSVQDTGIGIEQEAHQRIFERFRQANDYTGQQYGGNGLGLSIAKSYVELLGGTIWLESVVNQGTTFYFTIQI